MKLSFRDLKQQKFTIEAEPSETIAQVKEKIATEKGWEASQQKLIYSGKILADAKTVESYNIEEKGFIVCMVSKPKTAPAPAPPKPATPSTPSAATSTPAPPPAPQQVQAPAASNPPPSPSPAGAGRSPAPSSEAPGSFNDPSALLVGQTSSSVIEQMEAMGFEQAEIHRAMRAAYFNPDRAIEYLLTGIPESVQAEQRQATPGSGARGSAAPTSPTATITAPSNAPASPAAAGDDPINLFEAAAQAGGGQGGGARGAGARSGMPSNPAASNNPQINMDFLRNSPHFQQLRQLVQQQPAMLEPILQQVAEGNPPLAQMIGQNQDQFLQLLSEDIGGDAIGGMGETGPMPPGAVPVSVTEEERDAIERLCRLGFPRDAVVQAYFACDKNEELAANFLFDQPDDDQD